MKKGGMKWQLALVTRLSDVLASTRFCTFEAKIYLDPARLINQTHPHYRCWCKKILLLIIPSFQRVVLFPLYWTPVFSSGWSLQAYGHNLSFLFKKTLWTNLDQLLTGFYQSYEWTHYSVQVRNQCDASELEVSHKTYLKISPNFLW